MGGKVGTMVENNIREQAMEFLELLIDKPLCYGFKSSAWDLYDFGFGPLRHVPSRRNPKRKVGAFVLHVTCRFKIVCKIGKSRVKRFYEDTTSEEFHCAIQPVIGLPVKRVALSEENDLWLDFGDYWIVFVTYENNEESWRFFTFTDDARHLVASDRWITLD